MGTYIALLNYTDQGIRGIKESPDRLDAGRAMFADMGVVIKDVWLTMGQYDLVVVLEAPDDETAAKAILMNGMGGNVSSETLKAFPEADYRSIIASLP